MEPMDLTTLPDRVINDFEGDLMLHIWRLEEMIINADFLAREVLFRLKGTGEEYENLRDEAVALKMRLYAHVEQAKENRAAEYGYAEYKE